MRVLACALLLVSATAKRFGRFDSANCALSKETGPCKAAFQRYFWNPESGECEEFVYGGCRGNDNNFQSVDECERRCGAESSEESENGWEHPFVPFFKREKTEFMEQLAELRERFELRELFSEGGEGNGLGSGPLSDIHEKLVDFHDKLVEKYPDGYDGVGSGLFADFHDKIVEVHDKIKDGEGFGSGSGGFLDSIMPDSEDIQDFKDEVKEAAEGWKAKFEEAFSNRYGAPQFGKRPDGSWYVDLLKKQNKDKSGEENADAVRPRYPVRSPKPDRKDEESTDDAGQEEQEETGLVAPAPDSPDSPDSPKSEESADGGQSKKAARKEKKAAKKDKKAKAAEEDSPDSPDENGQEEDSQQEEDDSLVAPTPSSPEESDDQVAEESPEESPEEESKEESKRKGKKAAKKEKKAKKAKKSDD